MGVKAKDAGIHPALLPVEYNLDILFHTMPTLVFVMNICADRKLALRETCVADR